MVVICLFSCSQQLIVARLLRLSNKKQWPGQVTVSSIMCMYICLVSEVWGKYYIIHSVHGCAYHYHYCWWIINIANFHNDNKCITTNEQTLIQTIHARDATNSTRKLMLVADEYISIQERFKNFCIPHVIRSTLLPSFANSS